MTEQEYINSWKWLNVYEALKVINSGKTVTTDGHVGGCIPCYHKYYDTIHEYYPDDPCGESFTDEEFLKEFKDEEFREIKQ
jgi:hypothetical protein